MKDYYGGRNLYGALEVAADRDGGVMRICARGWITIRRGLRERFGLDHNVEADLRPRKGLLVHGRTPARHSVERAYAVLDSDDTHNCVEHVRGQRAFV